MKKTISRGKVYSVFTEKKWDSENGSKSQIQITERHHHTPVRIDISKEVYKQYMLKVWRNVYPL